MLQKQFTMQVKVQSIRGEVCEVIGNRDNVHVNGHEK